MPITKGPLSGAWWQVLTVSLEPYTSYSKARESGSAFSYHRLQRFEPEVSAAIDEVFDNDRSFQADVYTLRGAKTLLRFVVGVSSQQRELLYPPRVDGALENKLLLNANLLAQRNLFSYMWQQSGGVAMLLGWPGVALVFFLFGMKGYDIPTPPGLGGLVWFVTMLMFVMAASCLTVPYLWRWRLHRKLRRALQQISDDYLAEEAGRVRAKLHTRSV